MNTETIWNNLITVSKDKDSTLALQFDYSEFLGSNDTISTSSIINDAGITGTIVSSTNTTINFTIAAGSLYNKYRVTIRILTNAGITLDRSIHVFVVEN